MPIQHGYSKHTATKMYRYLWTTFYYLQLCLLLCNAPMKNNTRHNNAAAWQMTQLTMLSSSNFARVNVSEKSSPSKNDSISMRDWCCDDRALFAFSTSRRSFCTARLLPRMSLPFFFLYSLMKCSMTLWSKSSPPAWQLTFNKLKTLQLLQVFNGRPM